MKRLPSLESMRATYGGALPHRPPEPAVRRHPGGHRRDLLTRLLVATVTRPLAWLGMAAGTVTLRFGLVRSGQTRIRDGWILGDRDR